MGIRKFVKLDDISSMQQAEWFISESKKNLTEWWERALEFEDGDIAKAVQRFMMGVATGTLKSAMEFGAGQTEKGEGVSLTDLADRIVVSPCFFAMVAWVVGEKLLTDDIDIEGIDE